MAAGVPDVLSAFLIELNENVVIQKKTFAFLRGFNVGTLLLATRVKFSSVQRSFHLLQFEFDWFTE